MAPHAAARAVERGPGQRVGARRIDDFGTIYRYSAAAPRAPATALRAARTVQYVDVPPLGPGA